MIFRLLGWIGGLLLGVALSVLVLFNRHDISLTLIPFEDAFTMPAYLPILVAALIGTLFGALMIWMKNISLRFTLYGRNRTIRKLEKTIDKNEKALDQKPDPVLDTMEDKGDKTI